MRTAKITAASLIVLILYRIREVSPFALAALASSSIAQPQAAVHEEPAVMLKSASGAMIPFQTQNGKETGGMPPQEYELPHLVLNRNGRPAPVEERTLLASVRVPAPPPGVFVTLELETQHGNPDTGIRNKDRIPVWSKTVWAASHGNQTVNASVDFEIVLETTMVYKGQSIKTPTDYYRYNVQVHSGGPERSLHTSQSRDFAFLLESQWVAPLGNSPAAGSQAGPRELAVYYADMFPFGTQPHNPKLRLLRQQVDVFVGEELLPAMLEAYRTQTEVWGLTWHPEWTSFRPQDGPGRLGVALFKYNVWYHGPASSSGSARISIRVDGGMGNYRTLLDGVLATFHHELFHNFQRSIYQHKMGIGDVSGMEGAWMFFSEGTAELATSVGQPEVQFSNGWGQSAYRRRSSAYLGREGTISGSLNKSISKIYPYDAAPYWRFLYEQCGGLSGGLEDPAAGLQVIRTTLETLYSGEIVDITASTDLVGFMPAIMDRVFEQTGACPFQTYSDSLVNFSRAIYLLKVENGRCGAAGSQDMCGFYDPEQIYPTPNSQLVAVRSLKSVPDGKIDIPGSIPNSYGIDLLDVLFDPSLEFSSLMIEFGHPGGGEFALQAFQMVDGGEAALPVLAGDPQILDGPCQDRKMTYQISRPAALEANRLGLVITRLDPLEGQEALGEYVLRLRMVE